ncbi:uncharacterized protein J3D65DRAFT_292952 [Phyllosticta citribraziliensis]|uniref:Uncharacterized protein n=1 Tax=Phyllosticta citribraziliensis TaxID=989973 RepID=A0ABR1LX17_9PEZI
MATSRQAVGGARAPMRCAPHLAQHITNWPGSSRPITYPFKSSSSLRRGTARLPCCWRDRKPPCAPFLDFSPAVTVRAWSLCVSLAVGLGVTACRRTAAAAPPPPTPPLDDATRRARHHPDAKTTDGTGLRFGRNRCHTRQLSQAVEQSPPLASIFLPSTTTAGQLSVYNTTCRARLASPSANCHAPLQQNNEPLTSLSAQPQLYFFVQYLPFEDPSRDTHNPASSKARDITQSPSRLSTPHTQ